MDSYNSWKIRDDKLFPLSSREIIDVAKAASIYMDEYGNSGEWHDPSMEESDLPDNFYAMYQKFADWQKEALKIIVTDEEIAIHISPLHSDPPEYVSVSGVYSDLMFVGPIIRAGMLAHDMVDPIFFECCSKVACIGQNDWASVNTSTIADDPAGSIYNLVKDAAGEEAAKEMFASFLEKKNEQAFRP